MTRRGCDWPWRAHAFTTAIIFRGLCLQACRKPVAPQHNARTQLSSLSGFKSCIRGTLHRYARLAVDLIRFASKPLFIEVA